MTAPRYIPMDRMSLISSLDALAQCKRCKQIWSYDGLDALIDSVTSSNTMICRNCKTRASLYQGAETIISEKKGT